MIYDPSREQRYTSWILSGTSSPCCGAPLRATNVRTKTGYARDMEFTDTSKTYCSKCARMIDDNPMTPEIDKPKDPLNQPMPPPATPLENPRTWLATIERVIDADTFDVTFDLGFGLRYKARVRLAMFNAPEAGTLKGDELTSVVKSAIEGQQTIITTYRNKDRYGRTLADVRHPNGVDLATWLARNQP